MSKKDYIKQLLYEEEPTVLSLLESNLSHDENAPKILYDEYEIHDSFKKRIISYYRRDSGLKPVAKDFDFDAPCHVFNGREITLASIYSEFKKYGTEDELEEDLADKHVRLRKLHNTIRQVHGMSKRLICIAGDFNLDWQGDGNVHLEKYKRLLNVLGYQQKIHNITHPKRGRMRKGTIIDHVLSKGLQGVFSVIPCAISDHHAVCYDHGTCKRIGRQKLKTITYQKYDEITYNYAEKIYPFHDEYDFRDTERTVQDMEKFLQDVNKKATHSMQRKEFQQDWWHPGLLKYKNAFINDPNNHKKRTQYRKAMQKAHRLHDSKIKEKNKHPFRKDEIGGSGNLVVNGTNIESPQERAQAHADYFFNKQDGIIRSSNPNYEEHLKKFSDYNTERGIQEWGFEKPTPKSMGELIRKLPNKKSSGKDGTAYTLAKHLSPLLKKPLALMYSELMDQKKIPSHWLSVIITAVFKKGTPTDPANYRPVALGQLCMRLLEKHFANELNRNSKLQPLLGDNLHGFTSGKSCESCLIAIKSKLKKYHEEKLKTCLVLLDATCAFDATPRGLILGVLKALKCDNNTLAILEQYLLQEWTMQVKTEGEFSRPFRSQEGVIQGGGCSANLYCFMSTIVDFLLRDLGDLYLYADDSCLIVNGTSNEEVNLKVETAINKITQVFEDLGLTINEKKSEIMPVYDCEVADEFYVKTFRCEPSKSLKFLGCMLQSDMKPVGHLDLISQKISKAAHTLRQQAYNRNKPELSAFIHAYILSHLNYVRNFWLEDTTEHQRKKIQSKVDDIVENVLKKNGKIPFGRKTNRTKMRAKYKLKDAEMLYEEVLIRKAFKLKSEIKPNRRSGRLKQMRILDIGRNEPRRKMNLKKTWNSLLLGKIAFESKSPNAGLKLWLKSLFNMLFEMYSKTGRLLRPPEAPDGSKFHIPILWRFEQGGNLSEKLDRIYRKCPMLKGIYKSQRVSRR